MTPSEIIREIERCDRQIAEYEAQPIGAPAYLTTLGIEDWRGEKRILEKMLCQSQSSSVVRP
jgi:hypothetical protein